MAAARKNKTKKILSNMVKRIGYLLVVAMAMVSTYWIMAIAGVPRDQELHCVKNAVLAALGAFVMNYVVCVITLFMYKMHWIYRSGVCQMIYRIHPEID